MSERMRRAGAPELPKEGIYLDAALAVIGEQLEERIDGLARRRRLRARLGMLALSALTITSGGVAAIALTTAAHEAPVAALTAEYGVRCVDAGAAYFDVRYRTVEEAAPADRASVCELARTSVETGFAGLRSATPARLRAVAEELLTRSRAESGADAPPVVVVDAAFRPLGGPQPAPTTVLPGAER